MSATPEIGWEGDVPESRVVTVEQPDKVTPSEAIVERDVPTVVTYRAVTGERLEGMHVLLRSLGGVPS